MLSAFALDNSAHKMPRPSCSMEASNVRNRMMHRPLQLCALVLTLLAGPALAQAEDPANDEARPELPADAPLDLSTPELEPGKLTPTAPFAEKPPVSDWGGWPRVRRRHDPQRR